MPAPNLPTLLAALLALVPNAKTAAFVAPIFCPISNTIPFRLLNGVDKLDKISKSDIEKEEKNINFELKEITILEDVPQLTTFPASIKDGTMEFLGSRVVLPSALESVLKDRAICDAIKISDPSNFYSEEKKIEFISIFSQNPGDIKIISDLKNNKETFVTTGAFMRPISGPITSPFGWRVHPIFKSRIFHSGIDIGGANGGAIKAANSGKVIFAGWQGGYGKVVIIDHGRVNGKPTTTLYAHMSVINVSNGQSVGKGQVIGKEGSTGYSTGPHCHFEVRVNGVPQNPLQYI